MKKARKYGPAPYEVYTELLAHELRTPVAAVVGYLDLLENPELFRDPERLQQYLSVVRRRAADLARVVSELTTFTSITAGRDVPWRVPRAAALPAIVEELVRERPVRVEASPDAAAATLDASVDAARLRLILQQLLDNAFRYGTPGSEVLVHAALDSEPPRLVVRVANQGDPIPEAIRATIFEPFRQADEYRRRRYGGLGLGLTVARRAAEGAGGSLVLEPGAPTTFRLEVPLREDSIRSEVRALRERAAQADAQTLRAIQDLRAMRERATQADAQSLRAIQDLRALRAAAERPGAT